MAAGPGGPIVGGEGQQRFTGLRGVWKAGVVTAPLPSTETWASMTKQRGGFRGFWTVTMSELDLPTLPDGSTAVAVGVLDPFVAVVVFQLTAYGGDVTGAPSGLP